MKKTVKLIALSLALLLCTLALVSCSRFGSIKSAFEDNGYALKGESKEGEITLESGTLSYTIHTFQKEAKESDSALGNAIGGLTSLASTAVVWEFSSDSDLKKALEENKEMKELLEDASESDLINGNCFLMTLNPEAIEIFKGTK